MVGEGGVDVYVHVHMNVCHGQQRACGQRGQQVGSVLGRQTAWCGSPAGDGNSLLTLNVSAGAACSTHHPQVWDAVAAARRFATAR